MKLRSLSLAALAALLALASTTASAQTKEGTPGVPEMLPIRMEKVDALPALRNMQIIAPQAGGIAPVNPTVKSIKRPTEAYLAGPDTAVAERSGYTSDARHRAELRWGLRERICPARYTGRCRAEPLRSVGQCPVLDLQQDRDSAVGPTAGNTLWSGFGGTCQTRNAWRPDHPLRPADAALGDVAVHILDTSLQAVCCGVDDVRSHGNMVPVRIRLAVEQVPGLPEVGRLAEFVFRERSTSSTARFRRGRELARRRSRRTRWSRVFRPGASLCDLFSVNSNFGGMLPADLDGYNPPPANAPGVFVEVDDSSFGFPADQIMLWNFAVDWSVTPIPTSSFGVAGNRIRPFP